MTQRLSVEGISVGVGALGGMLEGLAITRDGRTITPLHRAPWIGTEPMPEGAAPHLGVLEGDFFCAPFGGAGGHGWPANGHWVETDRLEGPGGALTARFALGETIEGARLTKEITLRPGHPLVYQRHRFAGGEGAVPIAHHAMLHVPGGARLSFSPKDFGATPPTGLETDPARGRSLLAYPQRFDGLDAVRLADGRVQDLRRYPWDEAHEDFLTLYDPRDARTGWSAAVAAADGFVFFAVKDAQLLTQTSLWMSNGGRSYAPWSSRHSGVLGIEETTAYFGQGLAASTGPNPVADAGYRTALPLAPAGEVVVRYALGAIPLPIGWTEVASLAIDDGVLTLRDAGGSTVLVPFDSGFLA